ncbi:MAG TPA: cytochrome b/b6 domain-containing protein, partial [Bacillota bacterium]|nr:cytochrome b/b6 domain-containing protein [Bacillota bacterium]
MSNLSTKPAFPEKIQRFNGHQIYQHLILFLSMFVLIVTGFAIKWVDMAWAQWVIGIFGSFGLMFKFHLYAGIVMLLAGAYHIVWMILNFTVSGPKWSMVPNLNDAKCLYYHALYLLRIRKDPPPYERYTYLEKFEYLAGGYGIILMGATGALLWYPEVAAEWMPRWVIHMLRIAHSNEAIVAS